MSERHAPAAPGDHRVYAWTPFLLIAAALGAVAGLTVGAVLYRRYLPDFGWLFTASVAETAGRAALGLGISAVAWGLLVRLSGRRWRLGRWLAALVVAVPWLALAGWRLNRAWGLRPSDLLTTGGAGPNLVLLTVGVAVALGAAALLDPARRGLVGGQLFRVARRTVLAVGVGWALIAVLADLGGEPDPGKPHVFVLLVDALRADHVSAYGYPRPTTPALDALAADGVLFEQAVAASTFTKSSIASLFTGRYPYQHGVYWGSRRLSDGSVVSDLLPPAETTLAEAFRARGWLTEAWVQNSHLRRDMGFAQGFVDYRDNQGSIERIHRLAERFLGGPAKRYPLFVYLHYIDLHDPYRPQPPYDTMFHDDGSAADDPYADVDLAEWGAYLEAVRRGEVTLSPERIERLRSLYDGQLRFIDDRIGAFLGELRRRGLYDDSLIVVTSDHGDGFGEHGFIAHSTVPYEELVRVPLIVKLPVGRLGDPGVASGRRIERPVRLVDVLPTLLAAVGGSPPDDVAGCNLLPLLRGGEPPAECGVAIVEIAEEGAYPVVAARSARWKYIHHQYRPDEVYDLAADPGERSDLGEAVADDVAEVEDLRLRALAAVAARAALTQEQVELPAERIRELKALGYLE